jgi:signal transduction histidine kinase
LHFVEKEISVLQSVIETKRATIKIQIAENVLIRFNAGYLSSIIHNFLSNALKYQTPDTPPEILIQAWEVPDFVALEVSDNGIGIDLNKFGDQIFGLFKTFYKSPDSRGLGLYMSKIQMVALGGTVFVKSSPGKSSSFGARFPK